MNNWKKENIIIQNPQTLPIQSNGKKIYRAYIVDEDGKGITFPAASAFTLKDAIDLALFEAEYDENFPIQYPKFMADRTKQPIKEIPEEYEGILEFYKNED